MEDGRVKSRVNNYTGFFDKDAKGSEADAAKDNRLENYTDVVNGMLSHDF